MEQIKRYIYAVGKSLPKKQRADIEKELESSILDTLEDTYGKKDEYLKEEVESILIKLGPPWKVAIAYQKNRGHLIGPELINTYYFIIKIVSGAVSLGLFISFFIGLFRPELTIGIFFLELLKLIPSLIMGVVTAIGFVTVIFYLIERNVPGYQLKDVILDSDWKPKDLPKVPNENEKISIAESIIGITFSVLFIIIFNFFASKLGVYYTPSLGEGFVFVNIFSLEAIRTYLPIWNLVWVIGLIFQIFCLVQREWNIKTRVFDILTNILSIVVLSIMIKGPELIDFKLLMSEANTEIFTALTPIVEFIKYSLDTVFVIAIIGTSISLFIKIIKVLINISKMPNKL